MTFREQEYIFVVQAASSLVEQCEGAWDYLLQIAPIRYHRQLNKTSRYLSLQKCLFPTFGFLLDIRLPLLLICTRKCRALYLCNIYRSSLRLIG
jgi:hypothetical protein